VPARWLFVLVFLAYLLGPSRAPANENVTSRITAPAATALGAVYPSVAAEDRARWALRLLCAACCAGAVAITHRTLAVFAPSQNALLLAAALAFATPLWSWTSRADAAGALACLFVSSLAWLFVARPLGAASDLAAGAGLLALLLAPWLSSVDFAGFDAGVIAAYLVSPGRGLLFFAPIALLAALALARGGPPRRLVLAGALVIAVALLELSLRREAWGTLGFGPTLLSPYLPVLTVMAGCLPRAWVRAGALMCLPAAIAHGASVFSAGHTWDERRRVVHHPEALWDFNDSPWSDLVSGPPRPDPARFAALDYSMKEGDFVTREGRPMPWLAYGWETPEPKGIWAAGNESWIVIGAPPGDYVLTLIASAPSRRGRLQQLVVERPAEAPLEVAFTKQLWELEPLSVPFKAERNVSVLKLRPAHTHVLGHGDARRLSLFLAALRLQRAMRPGEVAVVLDTERGPIQLAVDTQRAPKTAANFLRYVDAGHYDGGVFHRTVKPDNQPNNAVRIEVIQGGADPSRKKEAFGPIAIERTRDTGLRHLDGTLSMARAEPDTATSDFFLCIGDQPSLDFGGARNPDGQGFAAFGRVLAGMDVVRAIQSAPAEGQRLTPPIRILKARRR
jgi:peptidyl-prolyl cis-trans isomerase A (cyclophilin A)